MNGWINKSMNEESIKDISTSKEIIVEKNAVFVELNMSLIDSSFMLLFIHPFIHPLKSVELGW